MDSLAGKFAAQLARLAPFGKRSGDPITNIKAATRWVANLPVGDAFKCQEAILNELKRFNEHPAQYTKDRLAVLMLLDERSQDLQDTLVRQYLRNPRMSRHVESQLWHAVYSLYWEIARGYHAFVLHFARDAGKHPHESHIPLITLRAIRTFGQLLKWRAFRYLPASEKLWLRLHNLYRVAESEDFHRKPLRAYDGDAFDSTCESTYLHILMLNLANSGTLYPKQLDLLDTWLQGWESQLQLDQRLDSEAHHFAIDLSEDHEPRRVRKTSSDKPMRYWSTAGLLHTLGELETALHEGRSPAELGLSENARTAESLELLDHLQHHWASLAAREQRRAPRAPTKRLIDVAHGLNTIIDLLKMPETDSDSAYGAKLNYNEALDVQLYGFVTDRTRERESIMRYPTNPSHTDVERWVMQDASECGYGALVEAHDMDWLRVGALIGLKSQDASEWQLGIVRRLSRHNDDTTSVGIETLGAAPVLTMLYDTTSPSYTVNGYDNTGNHVPHPSLWLSDNSGAHSLIIDPVHYMPGKTFQIRGVPGRSFIALGKQVERSEGWIRVLADPVENGPPPQQ